MGNTRDTNTTPLSFTDVEIDIAHLQIRELRKFSLIVNENLSEPVALQIDKIDFSVSGYKTYTLGSRKQIIKAEFGTVQKLLED